MDNTTLLPKIMAWLATGDRGLSSETMALTMALAIVGTPLGARRIDYPHDPADFNRCLKFVAAVPEARQHFYTIAKLSKEWAAIIQHWDRIEAQFLDEVGYDWCRRREAPKTYALMRKVLDGAA